MIDIENALTERYPQWFTGRRGVFSRALTKSVTRLTRLDQINAFLQVNYHLTGFAFIEAALAQLDVRYTVDNVERERIPETGKILIVANHPLGAMDALALLDLVGRVRRDVKILANDVLCSIPALRSTLLPIKIFGGKPCPQSLQAVNAALEAEQAVIVFPAGEVSRMHLKGIADVQWRKGFLHFARAANANVLPIKVIARNSAWFYGLSMLHKLIGTAMLPREIFNARGIRMDIRIGLPKKLDDAIDDDQTLASVRDALYAIGTRKETTTRSAMPIIHKVRRSALQQQIQQMELLGQTPDGKQIYAGALAADSLVLRELGRLREHCFRAVGEGTSKAFDVDQYDTWYEHIVLWDRQQIQIAGAYRIAQCASIVAARGISGLYTASLFDYAPQMRARLMCGAELGRSFVAPAYWGSRSLDYLWFGIGAYLRRYPHVRYLYGPVSISSALPIAAREQLVAYYDQFFGDRHNDVQPKHPFRFLAAPTQFESLNSEQSFALLKANLDRLGAKVPVLYRQYTELCDPGGVRFLGFGVDPDFNNSIDGLIEVDLLKMRPKKRDRYLGAALPTLPTEAV